MAGAVEPRRRGRPKGSTNRRPAEFAGYVAARYGGTAAQQMAAVALVTPAEVRKAGGVLQARLAKARELAQALNIDLVDAWKILAAELAQLAPYTDKRQPLAVEAKGAGFAPSVVVQIEAAGGQVMPRDALDADFVEVFQAAPALVSQAKSHVGQQVLDLAEELDARASD